MTPSRRLSRLAPLALVPALLLAACTTSNTPETTLAFIELVPRAVTLAEGDTRKLTAIGTYSDGSVLPLTSGVTFSSSEAARATVSADGTITAVAAGATTVIATAGSRTATCAVTVTAGPPRLLSIAVTPSPLPLLAGATQALTVTATFSSGAPTVVTGSATFISSDPSKATVSAAGVVTAVAAGPTTITATYAGQTATTLVTVTAPVVQSIAVTPPTATVAVGASQALTVTATYAVGPTANVTATATYASSDTAKATVSAAGVVTGVAAGPATITATFGGQTATSVITVAAPVLQSIAVTPAAPTLAVGGTQQLTVTATYDVGPTGDVTGTATYESSAPAVATVSAAGLVTAVAVGPATITATFGGQTATSAVTVTAISPTDSAVFVDDFAPGVSFSSFGGSALNGLPARDTTPANLNPNSAGRASLKVDILGTGDFAGGTWFTSVPRDLRAFNALTFWAKASTANVLNVSGIGINATGAPFKAEALQFPLTGTWTKFTIPLPDPTKAVGMDGLFHFADGAKGYTIWFSDIQYEALAAAEVGPPTGATVGFPSITVAVANTFQIDPAPNTVSFTTPVIPVGGSLKNVAFRWYALSSSASAVATVSADGLVTGVASGSANISATLAGTAVPGVAPVTVTGGGGPTAPAVAAPAPSLTTRPAANVLSLLNSSGVYVDQAATNWNTFGNGGLALADFTVPGTTTPIKKYSVLEFVGVGFTAFDNNVAGMTHLHVDVWTPDATQFSVKFGASGAGGANQIQVNYTSSTILQGQWISLDVPLAGLAAVNPSGTINEILWVDNVPLVERGTFFIDNVYFWK